MLSYVLIDIQYHVNIQNLVKENRESFNENSSINNSTSRKPILSYIICNVTTFIFEFHLNLTLITTYTTFIFLLFFNWSWFHESKLTLLLIITTIIYLTQGIIRKNCKTCNNKNLSTKENQEEVELQPLSVDNQANTEEIHPQRRVLTIPTTNFRIA